MSNAQPEALHMIEGRGDESSTKITDFCTVNGTSGGLPHTQDLIDEGTGHSSKLHSYTLSASKYSPPKRTSKPVISIPAPHLPLRKRASQELRERASAGAQDVQDIRPAGEQQSLAQMARSLRPMTNRWSGESSIGPTEKPSTVLEPPQAIADRPNTAHETLEETESDTLSPLKRPKTAISEYGYNRNAHRTTAISEPALEGQSSPRFSSATSPRLPANFWRDGGAASIRESIMSSTATDSSSAANTSTTSIWTARSSRTTYDGPSDRYSRVSDDDLSTDDVVAMYAEGFKDDKDDARRRSMRRSVQPPVPPLPQASDKPAPQEAETPSQSSPVTVEGSSPAAELKTTSTRSSDTLTENLRSPLSRNLQAGGSQRRPAKVLRDFYGFKQESQYVTQNRYKAWHGTYQKHLDRRKKKWVYMMNSHGLPSSMFPDKFPPPSKDVKRYIRKGVPPEWRGAAWFFYGDGAGFLTANPGLYDRLVKQSEEGALPEIYRDMIERDLHRTFPDNVYFKPDPATGVLSENASPPETDMIRSLRRILQAFGIHHPQVGYCQSLNFLGGLLLLFMKLSFRSGNFEERAFALLCILTEKYLPGTHGVVLEGCNVDIGVLMTILQETMPAIWDKLDNNNRSSFGPGGRKNSRTSVTLRTGTEDLPTVSLATTAWFMSCFVGSLPIESVCRVWDCLWYEGSKTIFRVALAIFKLGERQIKQTNDPAEVFQIVQTLPRGLLDANELMQVATMKSDGVRLRLGAGTPGFGGLSQKTVETRREERRIHAKGLRDSQGAATTPDGVQTPPVPEVPSPTNATGPGLKRSVTRGTLKRLKSMRRGSPNVS